MGGFGSGLGGLGDGGEVGGVLGLWGESGCFGVGVS